MLVNHYAHNGIDYRFYGISISFCIFIAAVLLTIKPYYYLTLYYYSTFKNSIRVAIFISGLVIGAASIFAF